MDNQMSASRFGLATLFLSGVGVASISPAVAGPCSTTPPPGLAPDGCPWAKTGTVQNWQGPETITQAGPVIETLDSLTFMHCTEPIIYPCGTPFPDQVVTEEREIEKTHQYTVGGTLGGSVDLSGFAIRLIGAARASVEFNGQLQNTYRQRLTIGISGVYPVCSKFKREETIERWTSTGSYKTAAEKITWCGSCTCDEGNTRVTYCGEQTVTGNATGWVNKEISHTPLFCPQPCAVMNCPD